jgi:PKHD-type hydroxylase
MFDYYYIPTGIDREVAQVIRNQCKKLELKTAGLLNEQVDLSVRDSKIAWLPTDNWIAGMLAHFIEVANQEHFKYNLTCWANPIQYTEYSGAGTKYGWHPDIAQSEYRDDEIRKLSISLFLSDPDEYEGGEFQLIHVDRKDMETVKPPMGTAIIFPSTSLHRVRPIKSGKRISLVGWMGGPQFR